MRKYVSQILLIQLLFYVRNLMNAAYLSLIIVIIVITCKLGC